MKILSNRSVASCIGCGIALLCGCASTGPSQQLVTARNEYAVVSSGPAATFAPDQLLEARNLLEQAEEAEDGSVEEQHFAYLADRQARKAGAEGAIREDQKRLAAANQKYVLLQEQGRVAAERGLSETQRRLTETERAHKEAEARAARAMADLEALGRVKEEATETILTLPAEVLFKTGQASLLPIAESRLDSVAKALTQLDASQEVVIEGHTDSVGSAESNQRLSKERAEAVRSYLIGQGVSAEQLTAVGKGELEPIADNDTAEGRAINRRVELVIEKLDVSEE